MTSYEGDRAKRRRTHNGASHQQKTASAGALFEGDAQSKRKWTRIVLRELYDLGYTRAAACLEEDADVRVRSAAVEMLQDFVAQHRWDDAVRFLQHGDDDSATHDMLPLRTTTPNDRKDIMLLLLKRKFVDLVLQHQPQEALHTFQQQILSTFALSQAETEELALLLLCSDESQMKNLVKLPLQDADLLSEIESLLGDEDVVPKGYLRHMVRWKDCDNAQTSSFANANAVDAKCVGLLLQHTHEVLDVAFSPSGELMASVGRDGKVLVWTVAFAEAQAERSKDTKEFTIRFKLLHSLHFSSGPPDSISWSPDSQELLTCGGDSNSTIQLWSIRAGRSVRRFHHPADSVSVVRWLPNGKQFLSGSIEKSLVLWSVEDEAGVQYQWGGRRVLDLVVHPSRDHFFVLCSETELRVYNIVDKSDRLVLRADHLIASITMSPLGEHILLNFIEHQEHACFSIAADTITSRHRGFQQERFIVHPTFAGGDSELVVSGSEDGRIHVWRRIDGVELGVAASHSSVVNAVASHPVHRNVLISASDDETLRVWRLDVVE